MVVHKQDSSRVISRELVIGHLNHTNLYENQQVSSSCPTNMGHSENDMDYTTELHVRKSKLSLCYSKDTDLNAMLINKK